MASLDIVLYRFTSSTNAATFVTNNSGLDATPVLVSTADGVQGGSWVAIFPENTNQLPSGFTPRWTYDTDIGMITQFDSSLGDPTSVNIIAPDGTPIFYNGQPATNQVGTNRGHFWISEGAPTPGYAPWNVQFIYPELKGPFFTWQTQLNPGGQTPTITEVVNSTFTNSTLYSTTYQGPDFSNTNALAIQDNKTNIYLLKRDGGGTINYLIDGASDWSLPMPVGGVLAHVAIDASGNLLILGPGATTVQRRSATDGSLMLSVPSGGSTSSYRINFCSDRDNNIIVAVVAAVGGGHQTTTVMVKYDSSGNVVWRTSFQGASVLSFFTDFNMVRNMANAPNGDIYWDDFVSVTLINGSTGAVKWQQEYDNIPQDPYFGGSFDVFGFGIDTDLNGAVYVCPSSGVNAYENHDDPNDPKNGMTYSFGSIISYNQDGTLKQNLSVRLELNQIAVSSNAIFVCAEAGQLDGGSDFISGGWGKFPFFTGNIIPSGAASIGNYTITGHRPTPEDPPSGLFPAFCWSQQVT